MQTERRGFPEDMCKAIPWVIGAKSFVYLINFVNSIVIVRLLSTYDFGVFAFCRNMMVVLATFCSLGLNKSALRFIPELLAKNNISGLRRYITKTLLLQALAISAVFFLALADYRLQFLSKLFNINFRHLIIIVVFLAWVFICKEFFYSVFTANYMAKTIAFTSVTNVSIWLMLTVIVLKSGFGVGGVLLAQLVAVLTVTFILFHKTLSLYWKDRSASMVRQPGIGRKRVAVLSGTNIFGAVTQYVSAVGSGIFFIGYFYDPELVGYFSLGNYVSSTVLTFVPFAVISLFTAGFSESYTKDSEKLPQLINTSYKLLILAIIPLSIFGVCFADKIISIIYGSKMLIAGVISRILFGVYLLGFVSVPLSMALTAKEKVQEMIPYQIVQVTLQVSLNFVLIKYFGWTGAVAAIILTFLITMPFILNKVRRIIGGIYFPAMFLFKVFLAHSFVLLLLPFREMVHSIWPLVILGFMFSVLWIGSMRLFRIVKWEDVKKFYGEVNNKYVLMVLKLFIREM